VWLGVVAIRYCGRMCRSLQVVKIKWVVHPTALLDHPVRQSNRLRTVLRTGSRVCSSWSRCKLSMRPITSGPSLSPATMRTTCPCENGTLEHAHRVTRHG